MSVSTWYHDPDDCIWRAGFVDSMGHYRYFTWQGFPSGGN